MVAPDVDALQPELVVHPLDQVLVGAHAVGNEEAARGDAQVAPEQRRVVVDECSQATETVVAGLSRELQGLTLTVSTQQVQIANAETEAAKASETVWGWAELGWSELAWAG